MRLFQIRCGRSGIFDSPEGFDRCEFFPTKKLAVAQIKAAIAGDDWDYGNVEVDVVEIETCKINKRSLCEIINSGGGSFVERDVKTYRYVVYDDGKLKSA